MAINTMAAKQVDQTEVASSNSRGTGDEISEVIASVPEKASESLAQQSSDLSEQPASEMPKDAYANTIVEQPREPSPEPEAVKPKVNLCGVCNEKPGKYKCARCYLP